MLIINKKASKLKLGLERRAEIENYYTNSKQNITAPVETKVNPDIEYVLRTYIVPELSRSLELANDIINYAKANGGMVNKNTFSQAMKGLARRIKFLNDEYDGVPSLMRAEEGWFNLDYDIAP